MRIDPAVKEEARETLEPLGLSVAQAVDIFLRRVAAVGGLPFDLRQPRYNGATEQAMDEARDIAAGRVPGRRYATVAEMAADLDRD
jgi:DNA-damage-inducible protein J